MPGRYRLFSIFAIIIIIFFLVPTRIVELFARAVPLIIDPSAPCQWLRPPRDLANHQSLLGRATLSPFTVDVWSSTLPSSPDGELVIQIVLRNRSLGTVVFVYDENAVTLADNNTSGLGLIFTPPNSLGGLVARQNRATFSESDLRLLGPQQSCTHTVRIPAGNVLIDPALTSGTARVQAFYRNALNGAITTSPIPDATPIFNAQGLWAGGIVTSPSIVISQP